MIDVKKKIIYGTIPQLLLQWMSGRGEGLGNLTTAMSGKPYEDKK